MDIVEHREIVQDCAKFFIKCILREFNLAHIEVAYPADFEVLVDDLGSALDKFLQPSDYPTVGVFRCVFDKTMSRKSAAVGTGAIALSPLVDILDSIAEY